MGQKDSCLTKGYKGVVGCISQKWLQYFWFHVLIHNWPFSTKKWSLCPLTLKPGRSLWLPGPIEYSRSDAIWLLKLGHKRWYSFHLVCSLSLSDACPWTPITMLWKSPGHMERPTGEIPRPWPSSLAEIPDSDILLNVEPLTLWRWVGALICSICQLPWCTYSHCNWFHTNNMRPLKMDLRNGCTQLALQINTSGALLPGLSLHRLSPHESEPRLKQTLQPSVELPQLTPGRAHTDFPSKALPEFQVSE